MTYHVYIHANAANNFLLALTEDELTKVIEAHDTGASRVSIPGEQVVDLARFRQIRVFENPNAASKAQVIKQLQIDAQWQWQSKWRIERLEEMGRDVTKEKVKYGFGEKQRLGGLAPAVTSTTGLGLWDLLHPKLSVVSRKLFEDGSFKEAAQAALTEVDARVRDEYRRVHSDGKTGAPMMAKALARVDPVFQLFPHTDQDHDIKQEGYMHIFMGSMMALRNPKSHSNYTIEEQDAIELLFLASRLLRILDEAVSPNKV